MSYVRNSKTAMCRALLRSSKSARAALSCKHADINTSTSNAKSRFSTAYGSTTIVSNMKIDRSKQNQSPLRNHTTKPQASTIHAHVLHNSPFTPVVSTSLNFQLKSPTKVTFQTQTRSFQVNRAFPQYSIIGDNALLTIKPIMPTFKSVGQSNDAIAIKQKGRILIEFSPNNGGNQPGWNWDEKIGFALSVDEIGLLISQLPHYGVTLNRQVGGDQTSGFGGGSYDLVSATSSSSETIDKVLTAQPGDGATIQFRVDYMKDGIGGQTPPSAAMNETSISAPLEVVVEAGEWEVVLSLLRDSIPQLLGWNQMMSIGVQNAIEDRDD